MNLNSHSNLEGRHAFLSPSKSAWLNYEDDKLIRVFHSAVAAKRGTDLHDLACAAIKLGIKLPDNGTTLSTYVNDAIGFRMTPEQRLYATRHCFGTADALGFRNNTLRVHDLKTGTTHTKMDQLEIYAGLFCMEYEFRPFDITIKLAIYQNDKVVEHDPDPDDIMHVIDKIKTFSRILDEQMEEVPL
jgi:hypothetical protein